MFRNRVPRRICSPKRDELTGAWRKVHNEELHFLYFSPSRMIKRRRMRWICHVAGMGEEEECICDFGEKARRKETSRQIKT
jgi:hypothetical protein